MSTASDTEHGSWNLDLAGAPEKELKVRIPLPQHIQLHTLKVLRGQTISETVTAALAAYFRDLEAKAGADAAQRRLDAWARPEAPPEGRVPPKLP